MHHKPQRQKSSRQLPSSAPQATPQPQDKERRQMLLWSSTGILLMFGEAGGYLFSYMDEALVASRMYKKGYSAPEIQREIDHRYG